MRLCLSLLHILLAFVVGAEKSEDAGVLIEADAEHKGQSKVQNGRPVNPKNSRPYVVLLLVRDSFYTIRGGVIYDEYTILTGVFEIGKVYKVIAGKYLRTAREPNQQERDICSRSIHPKNEDTPTKHVMKWDYGILHLKEPLIFNEFVQPIRLPSSSTSTPRNCFLIGWGSISSDTDKPSEELREVAVSFSRCPSSHWIPVHETVGCLNGACYNDLHFPVVCEEDGKTTYSGHVANQYFDCLNSVIALSKTFQNDLVKREIEKIKGRCRPVNPVTTTTTTVKPVTTTTTTTVKPVTMTTEGPVDPDRACICFE